jgi:predicted SnoaL-like aldol condensation-catalyzing enzyme
VEARRAKAAHRAATKVEDPTWFDMFRVEAGMIAEHWDPAVRP